MRKFFLLLNPASGVGNKKRLQKKITSFFHEQAIAFSLFVTSHSGHGTALVKNELTEDFTDLLVIGGDGTLNEAINGLGERKIPIGLLSVGTGNDFAKALHLPKSLEKQLEIAVNGSLLSVDIGKCKDRLFANTVGFGFDGKVVEHIAKNGKPLATGFWQSIPLSGHLAYLFTVLKIVTGFEEPVVSFRIDGVAHKQPVFLMAINNGTVYGGGFKITPEAKLNDGLLDICLIGKISPVRRLLNFPKMQLGIHQNLREIQMLQAKQVEVDFHPELLAQVDGELMGSPPFTISVLPAHLEFRVAADS